MNYKNHTCVLCGKSKSTRTGDHQPPQSLYPKPRKPNIELHRVPACQVCNSPPGGNDDEEFKIIIGMSTGETREQSSVLIASMKGSLEKNRKLDRHIQNNYERGVWDLSRSVLEKKVLVSFDADVYSRVISRMVKGLYWRETGRIIDRDRNISVWAHSAIKGEFGKAAADLMNRLPMKALNDNTFHYKFLVDTCGSCIIAMDFFKQHQTLTYVHPAET